MDSILQFLSDCGTVLSRYGISFLRGAGLRTGPRASVF